MLRPSLPRHGGSQSVHALLPLAGTECIFLAWSCRRVSPASRWNASTSAPTGPLLCSALLLSRARAHKLVIVGCDCPALLICLHQIAPGAYERTYVVRFHQSPRSSPPTQNGMVADAMRSPCVKLFNKRSREVDYSRAHE
jgi:hypothetical protein